MSQQKIYLTLGFGIICLSSSSILLKELDFRGLPLLAIAFYRMLLASLLVSSLAIALKREELIRTSYPHIFHILIAALFLALHFASWTASLHYISVSRSVLLVTCHPILTILASRIFLSEKVSFRKLIAVFVAFIGILVILSESLSSLQTPNLVLLKGDLLALSGAATLVGYIIISKRLRNQMNLLTYTSLLYTFCALLLLPIALLTANYAPSLKGSDYLLLLILAIVPTLGGHTVFNFLLKDVSATLISIAFLGEPLGASLLAWLIWQQIPSMLTVLGGILVLVAIYLISISSIKDS